MLDLYKENTILFLNKRQGILPTIMLEHLLNIGCFVSDAYMEDITDMKCQIHHLHLEQYFIQQKHDQNWRHLC